MRRRKVKRDPIFKGYEWIFDDEDYNHEFAPSEEELRIARFFYSKQTPWFCRGTLPRTVPKKRNRYLPKLLRNITMEHAVVHYDRAKKKARIVQRALRQTGELIHVGLQKLFAF